MKYYLDTNIIIYSIKNSYPSIKNNFMTIPAQSIVIPSVVKAEIEYGARKSNNYEKTIELYNKFISAFTISEFDKKSAIIYGEIRAYLEKEGKLIGANDLMIASIVLANDGILVTHNTEEFTRIPGLKVEDWTL